jgi:hypothetical protein
MYRSRSGSQDMLLGAAVLPAATGYAPVRYNPPSPPHQYGYPNEHVQVFSPDQMYPVPQLPVQSPRQYQPQPQPQRAQTLQTMQSYPEQHQQYQQPVRSNSAGFPYPQQSVQSPQSPTSYPPSYSRTQSPRPM